MHPDTSSGPTVPRFDAALNRCHLNIAMPFCCAFKLGFSRSLLATASLLMMLLPWVSILCVPPGCVASAFFSVSDLGLGRICDSAYDQGICQKDLKLHG